MAPRSWTSPPAAATTSTIADSSAWRTKRPGTDVRDGAVGEGHVARARPHLVEAAERGERGHGVTQSNRKRGTGGRSTLPRARPRADAAGRRRPRAPVRCDQQRPTVVRAGRGCQRVHQYGPSADVPGGPLRHHAPSRAVRLRGGRRAAPARTAAARHAAGTSGRSVIPGVLVWVTRTQAARVREVQLEGCRRGCCCGRRVGDGLLGRAQLQRRPADGGRPSQWSMRT